MRSSGVDSATGETAPPKQEAVVVFPGPTGFDKMKDEIVSKYYLEGETWLMRNGVRNALPRDDGRGEGSRLDECFFVLQKCGLRAIATNDITAACAVLHYITDLTSSDLLTQATELLLSSASRIGAAMQDNMAQYKRSILSSAAPAAEGGGVAESLRSAASLSSGFKSAMSLASSTIGGGGAGSAQAAGGRDGGAAKDDIQFHENGGFWFLGSSGGPEDPWRVAGLVEAFNLLELCSRYTERLGRDVWTAGQSVFTAESGTSSGVGGGGTDSKAAVSTTAKTRPSLQSAQLQPLEKLKLCREDFEACGTAFANVSCFRSIAAIVI